MTAYITVLEMADDSAYADARARLVARAPEHGGTYRVEHAPSEIFEGSLTPQRVAVIEFESVEGARAFLATPEYDHVKAIRAASGADVSVVLVEGT